MRVGPLGCLALLGAGSVGWAIGRLPDVIDSVRSDLAAVAADERVELAAAVLPNQSLPAATVVSHGLATPPPVAVVATDRAAPPRRPATKPAALPAIVPAPLPLPGLPAIDLDLAAIALAAEPSPPASALTAAPMPAAARVPANTGFALATAAYAELAAGDRRAAAAHFAAALAADPMAENAALWRRALRSLTRRWSSETYVIMRGDGTAGLGTTPVLGGGQGGRSFSYTAAPLADHPLYAVIRTTGGRTRGLRIDGEADSEQAAFGLRWRAAPGATVSVERLVGLTSGGRTAWTLRLAGGGTRRIGPWVADAYGEAGVVGMNRRDLVAGGQARLFRPASRGELRIETGAGVWAGVQRAGTLVDRVDIGPTLSLVADSWHVRATVDYRLRVAGNAAPGSGPVLTVSRSF